MTTKVNISSPKPNHNPFRVRTLYVNQDVFNQALEDAIAALIHKKGVMITVQHQRVAEGETVPHAIVHDTCVIVIDEVRPE